MWQASFFVFVKLLASRVDRMSVAMPARPDSRAAERSGKERKAGLVGTETSRRLGDGSPSCLCAQARELLWREVEWRAGPVEMETSHRLGDGPPKIRTPGETDGKATLSGRSCTRSFSGRGIGDGVGIEGEGEINNGVGDGSDCRSAMGPVSEVASGEELGTVDTLAALSTAVLAGVGDVRSFWLVTGARDGASVGVGDGVGKVVGDGVDQAAST